MEEWGDVPAFGDRETGMAYIVRPSAYALVGGGQGRVAVVRSVDGIYLPGGGIEPGETPRDTIIREGLEECGWMLQPGAWTLRAVQFSFSKSEASYFEKRTTFMDARIDRADSDRLQPDHEVIWATAGEASRLLSHASHAWAVERWGTRQGR